MLTNIDLDEATVETAMRLTGERTKRAVVRRALEELIRIERLRQLRRARGTLQWQGKSRRAAGGVDREWDHSSTQACSLITSVA
jgi:Arc/MetJ family transcription regulator